MQAEERLREIYTTQGYGPAAQCILQAKGSAQYYLPVLRIMEAILHNSGAVIVVDTTNFDRVLEDERPFLSQFQS